MKNKFRFLTLVLILISFVYCGSNTSLYAAGKGYQFQYKGVSIAPHDKVDTLLKKLGKPNKRTKKASCAYDGEDITYRYNGITIIAYSNKKGGTEYLMEVEITGKNIKTKEGVKVGSTTKDMIKKYGKEKDNFGMYTYKKGKSGIQFMTENNKIEKIVYFSDMK